jgi:hypothetical protein
MDSKNKTALTELIERLNNHLELHKKHTGKFDVGVLVAKAYAEKLLQKEANDLARFYDLGVYDTIAEQEMQGETKFKQEYITIKQTI